MEKEIDVWIEPDGTLRHIEVPGLDLSRLGNKQSKRLSRIEWNENTRRWNVFLFENGNFLGDFETREKALEFEYQYFRQLLSRTSTERSENT